MLPLSYPELLERFSSIRGWAGDVTQGNRCALVMGKSLRLTPSYGQLTMRGRSGNDALNNMPFLDRMFVKAADVSAAIIATYGPADLEIAGKDALSAMKGLKGAVYLEDCWRTPSEKFAHWLRIADKKSGDHLDLWDGETLEIYRAEKNAPLLVSNSARVLCWWTQ